MPSLSVIVDVYGGHDCYFVAPAKLPIAAGVIGTCVTSRGCAVLSRVAIGSKTAGR
jgi:hypothetical protein